MSLTGFAQAPEPVETAVDVEQYTVDEEATKAKKVVDKEPELTWRDNPQNCKDTTRISAEPPFECLPSQPKQQQTVANDTAPSRDCYFDLLKQYDWDVATMQRIMRAESGCNPTNHNFGDNHGSCFGSYGLLQIGCVHGYTVSYLSSPANNIAAAYKVWQGQGYTAWTTY